MKFDILVLSENLSRQFNFIKNMTNVIVILHEDMRTYIIRVVSR